MERVEESKSKTLLVTLICHLLLPSGCRTPTRLGDPSNPTVPCATLRVCTRAALLAIRDDLAAKEPQTFGTLTQVEPSDDDAGGALVAEFGSVTDNGKAHSSVFDPGNSWRLRISISIGVESAKAASEVWYAATRSGRTIAARYHFASLGSWTRAVLAKFLPRWTHSEAD